jgi:hypothetical protein
LDPALSEKGFGTKEFRGTLERSVFSSKVLDFGTKAVKNKGKSFQESAVRGKSQRSARKVAVNCQNEERLHVWAAMLLSSQEITIFIGFVLFVPTHAHALAVMNST